MSPRSSHEALAALETAGLLKLVVTPNVDGLHEAAGSRRVIEIHGDHQHLQSLACGVTSKALQKPSSPPMSAP